MKKFILIMLLSISFSMANDSKYVPLEADEMIAFKLAPQPPKKTETPQTNKKTTQQTTTKIKAQAQAQTEKNKPLIIKGVGVTVY
ncbi:hypothetical protein [Sulfurospirillum sp. hDNRA2]|uniref:hypothetical protein n=1 Tax=Sulfurospirillum sp. hDNRA2 TaxID=3237298 RepID=UPI0020B8EAD9|nr:hypothetical protein [Sulfurospirillum sp. DNRA8]MCP3653253.1 hypothetical protein [Sulfurospirillum sp. DNRA8]MCR1812105.1 hypothetical protein [Sulfurospirillum sp. DNRA8]